MPSSATLARLSRNRPLVALVEALEQLELDTSVRLVGAVEVHDGACAFPEADCDPLVCAPLVLPRRRRHGRPH